jgi:hypothetical protein
MNEFKYDIGDLVVFQTPNMDIREWNNPKAVPYQTGMITFREKAGYKTVRNGEENHVRNSYYHILLPTGDTRYSQREDRLALAAKANP